MGLSNAWATHPAANYCAQDDSSPHQLEATRVFGRISSLALRRHDSAIRGAVPCIITAAFANGDTVLAWLVFVVATCTGTYLDTSRTCGSPGTRSAGGRTEMAVIAATW